MKIVSNANVLLHERIIALEGMAKISRIIDLWRDDPLMMPVPVVR